MRRIATFVATGAVAAAAAVALVAAPAGADTAATGVVSSASADTVASAPAGGVGTDATHKWHSYNGSKTVYAYGTYKKTSKYVYVSGYVRDSRSSSSKYHAAVVLYFTQKGKSDYQWAGVVNPKHHSTAKVPQTVRSTYRTHFYVAEGLAQYVKGKGWVVMKVGSKHKVY
jgi:hypothetical protein